MKKLFLITFLVIFGVINKNYAQVGVYSAPANAGTGGAYNTHVGDHAGSTSTNGNNLNNVSIGYYAGSLSNLSGALNTIIGANSGKVNNGSNNVFLGANSGLNNTSGQENVFLGTGAGISNTTGGYNVFVGYHSARLNSSGNYNTFVGKWSGNLNTTGNSNTFIGIQSGQNNSTGYENTFLGINAGASNATGVYNTMLGGYSGGNLITGNYNTFIGRVAVPNSPSTGTSPGNNTSNTIIIGDGNYNQRLYVHSNGNTGIGLGNNVIPQNKLEVKHGVAGNSGLRFTDLNNASSSIINPTNKVLSVNATGDVVLVNDAVGSTGSGSTDAWKLTGNAGTDSATNFIGTTDASSLTFKVNNTFSGSLSTGWTSFGYGAMPNGGGSNSAFGVNSLKNSSSGISNSAFGTASLLSNTTGAYNTALGTNALMSNVTGNLNIAIGYNSLRANPNSAGNIAIGFESIGGSTGDSNIAIGYRAFQNSSASGNIGVGGGVLSNLVSPATFNVAVGQEAGLYLSTGNYNSFFGRSSGRGSANFNTGNSNSFFGYDSGINVSSGNSNSSFGSASGSSITTGGYNSFFGAQSGIGLTTGNYNVFLGNVQIPNAPATATSPGNDTSRTIILADGGQNTKLYIHSNGFTGIGLGNNIIPRNTLEVKAVGGSPSASGLRLTGLPNTSTAVSNPSGKVLSVDGNGDVILVNGATGSGGTTTITAGTNIVVTGNASGYTISSPTTNTLANNVNTMTSTVNGVVATAPIVNTVVNSITSGQLTTTVNGVGSTPISLPTITEVDGSVTNELSNLSLTGNVLTLTNPLTPANSVTLPSLTEVDGDITNELQNLGLTGNVLSISNGNSVTLPAYIDTDTDAQTLSIAGNQLTISNGNTVTLPTSTGGGTGDINIYKDNGTLTGNRVVTMAGNNLIFNTSGNTTTTGGRIYIGNTIAFTPANFPTTTGDYRLNVEGGILTEKVKVALRNPGTNWADYVFGENYKLMPLTEVEAFVKTNKHLPGISSAENLVKEGLDLGEMQAKQMEKIEELTLYAIEQNKKLESQQKQIEELKTLVNALLSKK